MRTGNIRILAAHVQGTLWSDPVPLPMLVGTRYKHRASLARNLHAAGNGAPVLALYEHMDTGRRYLLDTRHRNLPSSRDVEVR
jgi:hypothetical protein